MTTVKVRGLVVRTVNYGEKDRILTLFTDEYGIMTVMANGSRALKSRSLVATEMFCYASYVLNCKNDRYTVKEVELIESFFSLRTDVEKTALAGYICEVVSHVGTANLPDVQLLRLALNSLYAIANDKAPLWQIKGAFEMRAASELGFSPELMLCDGCGQEGEDVMLDVMNGVIYCKECRDAMQNGWQEENPDLSTATIHCFIREKVRTAFYYVMHCKIELFLSFKLEDAADIDNFSSVSEQYLLNHLETGFKTLDFYKDIKAQTAKDSAMIAEAIAMAASRKDNN